VQEAAHVLDTTVDAIRKRVQRGTIAYEKEEDGRVWILLNTARTRQDNDHHPTGQADHNVLQAKDETISELRERVEDLREQLRSERQGHAEARRLLAAALERIPPQLEAPPEPPDAFVSATEQPGQLEPQTPIEGPQEPVNRRYRWWQFWR